MMNDPIGDMLTRIRNSADARQVHRETPASKLRAWVLDVLADEGYIRGYEAMTGNDGHPAFEISLKYYEGTPVIRDQACVQARPPRLSGVSDIPQVRQGLGVSIVSTSKGRDDRCSARSGQCRRRSALHRVLREAEMSRIGKNRSSCRRGCRPPSRARRSR
jgi:small subunit ribosomal protein S8